MDSCDMARRREALHYHRENLNTGEFSEEMVLFHHQFLLRRKENLLENGIIHCRLCDLWI